MSTAGGRGTTPSAILQSFSESFFVSGVTFKPLTVGQVVQKASKASGDGPRSRKRVTHGASASARLTSGSPGAQEPADNGSLQGSASTGNMGRASTGASLSQRGRKRAEPDDPEISGDDPDFDQDAGHREPKASRSRVSNEIGGRPKMARRLPVSLKDLLEQGFLAPGQGVLSVHYKQEVYHADLLPDGSIVFKDQTFEAPSAFSVHVKRLLLPSKQGDDGWKSVLYQGRPLDDYRAQYRALFEAPQLAQPSQAVPLGVLPDVRLSTSPAVLALAAVAPALQAPAVHIPGLQPPAMQPPPLQSPPPGTMPGSMQHPGLPQAPVG